MKRNLILAFAVMMVFSIFLTGCGEDGKASPSNTATTFLEMLRADKLEEAEGIYGGTDFEPVAMIFGNDTLSDQAEGLLEEKIRGFEYTFGEINEGSTTATIQVQVKAYNLGAVVAQLQGNTVFMDDLLESDAHPFSAESNTVLINQIGQAKREYLQTVVIQLNLVDEIWQVGEITGDSDFFMAITGNLPDTLSTMTNSYKKIKAEAGTQMAPVQSEGEGTAQPQQQAPAPVTYAINNIQEATAAVENYLGITDADPEKPFIKVESEDSQSYMLRAYTITYNADTTKTETTLGWYKVDKVSGTVTESAG